MQSTQAHNKQQQQQKTTMSNTLLDDNIFDTMMLDLGSPKLLPTASPFASNYSVAMTQLLNSPVTGCFPQDSLFDNNTAFAVVPHHPVQAADDLHDSAMQQQIQTNLLTEVVHQKQQTSSFEKSVQGRCSSEQAGEQHVASREWQILHCDESVITRQWATTHTCTKLRSRSDESSDLIADTLYSSIKYELEHVVQFPAKQCPFLLVKVTIVDSHTLEEIKKSGKATILSGKTDESLLLAENAHGKGAYAAKMKIQFTDVSYHHGRKTFAFLTSFFLSNRPDVAFLTKVSAPFLVLARKPKQQDAAAAATPVKKTKKRAREEVAEELSADGEQQQQPKKKIKTCAPSTSYANPATVTYDSFMKQFDRLMNEQFVHLNLDQRSKASDAIMQRLHKEQQIQNAAVSFQDDLMSTFANLL